MANWKVIGFEVADQGALANVCLKAHFEVSHSEGNKRGFVIDQVTLAAPDVATFVAYADIPADLAVSWVKAALGESGVADVESRVQAQIDNTPDEVPMIAPPWVAVSSLPVPKR